MTGWRIVSYLLLPYVVVNLVWRGMRYRPYFHRWAERFGFVQPISGRPVIWVHAVSVGEVRSSAPLVEALLERYPRHAVLVTTMTPTGGDQVRALFGRRVQHSYAPYDFADSVRRFLDRVNPQFVVVAETEFWPNIFHELRRRSIPLLLVNVRLSAASLAGYLKVARLARSTLLNADLICAQTQTDAMRLRNLRIPDSMIRVTGNLKFDVPLPAALFEDARALRRDWGDDRPVWIAGSTHAGEEARLLDAFAAVRRRWPDLLLVLAPRNPERFAGVARLARRRRCSVALRTQTQGPLPEGVEVLVADTMGELQMLYAAADVAFVGGSLVRKGGQNILEPCAVGVPVLFGPHMFHFEDISAMALESGAARQVYDGTALAEAVALMLDKPAVRAAAGRAGSRLVERNHGALELTLDLLGKRLGEIVLEPSATQSADSPSPHAGGSRDRAR